MTAKYKYPWMTSRLMATLCDALPPALAQNNDVAHLRKVLEEHLPELVLKETHDSIVQQVRTDLAAAREANIPQHAQRVAANSRRRKAEHELEEERRQLQHGAEGRITSIDQVVAVPPVRRRAPCTDGFVLLPKTQQTEAFAAHWAPGSPSFKPDVRVSARDVYLAWKRGAGFTNTSRSSWGAYWRRYGWRYAAAELLHNERRPEQDIHDHVQREVLRAHANPVPPIVTIDPGFKAYFKEAAAAARDKTRKMFDTFRLPRVPAKPTPTGMRANSELTLCVVQEQSDAHAGWGPGEEDLSAAQVIAYLRQGWRVTYTSDEEWAHFVRKYWPTAAEELAARADNDIGVERRRLEKAAADVVLESTEPELREAMGDKAFDDLAQRGRAAAERALAAKPAKLECQQKRYKGFSVDKDGNIEGYIDVNAKPGEHGYVPSFLNVECYNKATGIRWTRAVLRINTVQGWYDCFVGPDGFLAKGKPQRGHLEVARINDNKVGVRLVKPKLSGPPVGDLVMDEAPGGAAALSLFPEHLVAAGQLATAAECNALLEETQRNLPQQLRSAFEDLAPDHPGRKGSGYSRAWLLQAAATRIENLTLERDKWMEDARAACVNRDYARTERIRWQRRAERRHARIQVLRERVSQLEQPQPFQQPGTRPPTFEEYTAHRQQLQGARNSADRLGRSSAQAEYRLFCEFVRSLDVSKLPPQEPCENVCLSASFNEPANFGGAAQTLIEVPRDYVPPPVPVHAGEAYKPARDIREGDTVFINGHGWTVITSCEVNQAGTVILRYSTGPDSGVSMGTNAAAPYLVKTARTHYHQQLELSIAKMRDSWRRVAERLQEELTWLCGQCAALGQPSTRHVSGPVQSQPAEVPSAPASSAPVQVTQEPLGVSVLRSAYEGGGGAHLSQMGVRDVIDHLDKLKS